MNLTAQNMTNSPASMFGLGELSTGEGGIYSGMGGVGIALRGENAYNSANPASLTGLIRGRRIIQSWNQRCSSVVERAFAGS